MSVTLVDNTAKILQFKSKNNRDTIEALKELLTLAENGQVQGIAGVMFGMNETVRGNFCIGKACENASNTIYKLDVLSRRIASQ